MSATILDNLLNEEFQVDDEKKAVQEEVPDWTQMSNRGLNDISLEKLEDVPDFMKDLAKLDEVIHADNDIQEEGQYSGQLALHID